MGDHLGRPKHCRLEGRFEHLRRDVELETVQVSLAGAGSVPLAEDFGREENDLASWRAHILFRWILAVQNDAGQRRDGRLFGFDSRRPVLHFKSIENLLLGRLDPPLPDLLLFEECQGFFSAAHGAFRRLILFRLHGSCNDHIFRSSLTITKSEMF